MAETVEAVLASRSFYDALGVARDAPADQIRRAYILVFFIFWVCF